MSLHYILDGYNILKQIPAFADEKLCSGRSSFIQFLKNSAKLKKQRCSIVFDGYEDSQQEVRGENFEIFFSKQISADDKIKSFVERSSAPRQIVVVTDDKEIRFFVRNLGAKILSVSEFLIWISNKPSTNLSQSEKAFEDEKILTYQQELEINRQLRKIWLKE
jgi:predicted RNA-binding protein with PIN domain